MHPPPHPHLCGFVFLYHLYQKCLHPKCWVLFDLTKMKEQRLCIHAETSEMSNKMVKNTSYLKILQIALKFQLSSIKFILRFTEIQSVGYIFVCVLTQILFL